MLALILVYLDVDMQPFWVLNPVEFSVWTHFVLQVAAVIKIQAFWRAKAAKRDYKQLGRTYIYVAVWSH